MADKAPQQQLRDKIEEIRAGAGVDQRLQVRCLCILFLLDQDQRAEAIRLAGDLYGAADTT
ncbi:MAG: hypothetical protein OXN95_09720 [bacterium]|nr:hypothetical protein [bacterium]